MTSSSLLGSKKHRTQIFLKSQSPTVFECVKLESDCLVLFLVEKSLTNINCLLACMSRRVKQTSLQNVFRKT